MGPAESRTRNLTKYPSFAALLGVTSVFAMSSRKSKEATEEWTKSLERLKDTLTKVEAIRGRAGSGVSGTEAIAGLGSRLPVDAITTRNNAASKRAAEEALNWRRPDASRGMGAKITNWIEDYFFGKWDAAAAGWGARARKIGIDFTQAQIPNGSRFKAPNTGNQGRVRGTTESILAAKLKTIFDKEVAAGVYDDLESAIKELDDRIEQRAEIIRQATGKNNPMGMGFDLAGPAMSRTGHNFLTDTTREATSQLIKDEQAVIRAEIESAQQTPELERKYQASLKKLEELNNSKARLVAKFMEKDKVDAKTASGMANDLIAFQAQKLAAEAEIWQLQLRDVKSKPDAMRVVRDENRKAFNTQLGRAGVGLRKFNETLPGIINEGVFKLDEMKGLRPLLVEEFSKMAKGDRDTILKQLRGNIQQREKGGSIMPAENMWTRIQESLLRGNDPSLEIEKQQLDELKKLYAVLLSGKNQTPLPVGNPSGKKLDADIGADKPAPAEKKPEGMAQGGRAGDQRDTIPARLRPGEVVMTPQQQAKMGQNFGVNPAAMFGGAGVPGFAKGGVPEPESQSPRFTHDDGVGWSPRPFDVRGIDRHIPSAQRDMRLSRERNLINEEEIERQRAIAKEKLDNAEPSGGIIEGRGKEIAPGKFKSDYWKERRYGNRMKRFRLKLRMLDDTPGFADGGIAGFAGGGLLPGPSWHSAFGPRLWSGPGSLFEERPKWKDMPVNGGGAARPQSGNAAAPPISPQSPTATSATPPRGPRTKNTKPLTQFQKRNEFLKAQVAQKKAAVDARHAKAERDRRANMFQGPIPKYEEMRRPAIEDKHGFFTNLGDQQTKEERASSRKVRMDQLRAKVQERRPDYKYDDQVNKGPKTKEELKAKAQAHRKDEAAREVAAATEKNPDDWRFGGNKPIASSGRTRSEIENNLRLQGKTGWKGSDERLKSGILPKKESTAKYYTQKGKTRSNSFMGSPYSKGEFQGSKESSRITAAKKEAADRAEFSRSSRDIPNIDYTGDHARKKVSENEKRFAQFDKDKINGALLKDAGVADAKKKLMYQKRDMPMDSLGFPVPSKPKPFGNRGEFDKTLDQDTSKMGVSLKDGLDQSKILGDIASTLKTMLGQTSGGFAEMVTAVEGIQSGLV